MSRRTLRLPLAALAVTMFGSLASASDAPSLSPENAGRHRIAPNRKIDQPAGSTPTSSGNWWGGSFLIAVALCGLGGVGFYARKFSPRTGNAAGQLKVIGRTSLTPRHSVHLLRAGDRILLIGTGPQGAPSLLGELDDEFEPPELSSGTSGSALPKFAARLAERAGVAS